MGESTVVAQADGATAKPGWYRGNTAAQPHRWLLGKTRIAGRRCGVGQVRLPKTVPFVGPPT
jgi:hypothetical protein